MRSATNEETKHLPRLLCLHGGGTNAIIFKLQLRAFLSNAQLKDRFRFVFAEAPFECEPGPGIMPFFEGMGPYKRWNRWLKTHPAMDDAEARDTVNSAIREAMEVDEGTGEWVGLLGFSQGAKVAASMLYEQQIEDDCIIRGKGNQRPITWRFGVLFAGRAPLISMSERTQELEWVQKPGQLPNSADVSLLQEHPEMRLRLPTVHVHGLEDEGLPLHEQMADECCAPGTIRVIQWDGNHRLPIKKADVDSVVDVITEVANEYSV